MFARLMGLATISPAELHQRLQQQLSRQDNVYIIDVNARHSWLNARVPEAVNLDSANLQESDLPADKTAALVFYCSNPLCRKAPNAAKRAKQFGFQNVQVMSAGFSGWLSAGLPTEAGE